MHPPQLFHQHQTYQTQYINIYDKKMYNSTGRLEVQHSSLKKLEVNILKTTKLGLTLGKFLEVTTKKTTL